MKVVKVRWHDSHQMNGWQDKAEVQRFADDDTYLTCSTVGYLLADHEKHITLVFSTGQDQHSDALKIPRFAIESMTTLREDDKQVQNMAQNMPPESEAAT